MTDDLSFGQYLKQKRDSKNITLRSFAEQVGVAASYVSDIEKGNRNPPEKYFDEIIKVLDISGDELNVFYDLVGKERKGVSPDLNDYIYRTDIARVALRRARDKDISDEMWEDFIKKIDDE